MDLKEFAKVAVSRSRLSEMVLSGAKNRIAKAYVGPRWKGRALLDRGEAQSRRMAPKLEKRLSPRGYSVLLNKIQKAWKVPVGK